jgi:hypothetical protein
MKNPLAIILALLIALSTPASTYTAPTYTAYAGHATPTPTYKNYGTLFRNEYGQNSEITTADGVSIDIGCVPDGVVLVTVDSITAKCKAVVSANSKSYQYVLSESGKWYGLPLQLGNGEYTASVFFQLPDGSYGLVFTHEFSVKISGLKPFTASSIMCDFSTDSDCVKKAKSLCKNITTDKGRVNAVMKWIKANISYDRDLANGVTSGTIKTYLPDPERTYSTRKGICVDYASLMCAMLRSQGIPTRIIYGHISAGYHAWNEVYIGGKWKVYDSTGTTETGKAERIY